MTSRRSSPCCTTMPCSPCPPTPCGFKEPPISAASCAAPDVAAKAHGFVATAANGCPAFGHYKRDPEGGHAPWALVVLEISGRRVSAIHSFLDPQVLFPDFGLPAHLPE